MSASVEQLAQIQRERLKGFDEFTQRAGAGCAYYALLSAAEEVDATHVIPRDFMENFGLHTPLVVSPRGMFRVVDKLRPDLELKVSKVATFPWVIESDEEIKQIFNIPDNIPFERLPNEMTHTEAGLGAVIFCHADDGSGHWYSNNESKRMTHADGSPMGGQKEIDRVLSEGRRATLVYFLEKAKADKE